MGKKREGTGEENVDLGKALISTCNGCAVSVTGSVEEMAARPETSELSSVSKQITDGECRERAKINENLLN